MTTTQRCKLQFSLIGMHPEKGIKWTFHLSQHMIEHDVILGSDLMRGIGLDILYSREGIMWKNEFLPIHFEGERERQTWHSVEPLAKTHFIPMVEMFVEELTFCNKSKLNPFQHIELVKRLMKFEGLFEPVTSDDIVDANKTDVTLDQVHKEMLHILGDEDLFNGWDNPCFRPPMGRINRCRYVYDYKNQHEQLQMRARPSFTTAAQLEVLRLTRFGTLIVLNDQRVLQGPATQTESDEEVPQLLATVEPPDLYYYNVGKAHDHIAQCGNNVLVVSHWDFNDHLRILEGVLQAMQDTGRYVIRGLDGGYIHKKRIARKIAEAEQEKKTDALPTLHEDATSQAHNEQANIEQVD